MTFLGRLCHGCLPDLLLYLCKPSPFNLLSLSNFSLFQTIKMLRQFIVRPAVTANRAVMTRSFSAAVPRMGEGDTGAPRSGSGAASG
jgi:hypothetical protein